MQNPTSFARFGDEPGWEGGREVRTRIAARAGRVAEEERKAAVRQMLREAAVDPLYG